jgi:hypothetical protein
VNRTDISWNCVCGAKPCHDDARQRFARMTPEERSAWVARKEREFEAAMTEYFEPLRKRWLEQEFPLD